MSTVTDLDPGIYTTTKNRRIMSALQHRNELLFFRETSTRSEITINIFTTNTPVEFNNSLANIEREQQAAGYDKLQFHYLICDDAFVYTGLELNESTSIGNGNNITIGLAGGQGVGKYTLSNMTPPQILSLVNIVATFIQCFEKVRIESFKIDNVQGLGQANIQPADLRARAERLV